MRGMRPLILLAAAVVLVVGFLLVRPDDDDNDNAAPAMTATTAPTAKPAPTTTAATTTRPIEPVLTRLVVTVRGGRPVGGIQRATATKDTPVLLVVRADVTDHVHVHGYDLMSDISPGHPARMQFRARLTGRFEIELEDAGRQIAQLTVLP